MPYESTVLRQLKKFVENEDLELKKTRTLAFALALVGWLGMFAALFGALGDHLSPIGIAIAGVIGGSCTAFSIWLNITRRQWHVIRPFVNLDAIRNMPDRPP